MVVGNASVFAGQKHLIELDDKEIFGALDMSNSTEGTSLHEVHKNTSSEIRPVNFSETSTEALLETREVNSSFILTLPPTDREINGTEYYVRKMLNSVYNSTIKGIYGESKGLYSDVTSEMNPVETGQAAATVRRSANNLTISALLSSSEEDSGQDIGLGQNNDLMSALLDPISPSVDNGGGSLFSRNSSSVLKDIFNLTLEVEGDFMSSLEVSSREVDSQGRFAFPGVPYFSALRQNYNFSSGVLPLSNHTPGSELFSDYPPQLLDFAVFCCILFIILGVPGNLITIIALVKCKKVHNATAVFIINLTLSDLMLGVFNLPLAASLFWHRAWVHSSIICILFPILRYGLVAVSVFSVLAITINRYVMIAHPTIYHKLYTKTWLAIMVIATWIGAFGALVPTLLEFWGTFGLDPEIGSCTIVPDSDGNSPKEFLFVFAFILPCLAICVCYARIFCIVHRADKKSHGHSRGFLHVNGKRKKHGPSPSRDSLTLNTLQASPLPDKLQLETLVKLSTSRNSVRVEIVEPGEKSAKEKEKEKKEKEEERKQGENPDPSSKVPTRTPSPVMTSGEITTDASSLLKTEVNGFSGHTSDDCGGGASALTCSPIRVCPPSAPESPVSEKSDTKMPAIERRPSTISGRAGAFSHLRGTFRKTRAGSFIARQPSLSAKDRRLLKMILVIFLSFVACYLPITLVKTFSKDDNPILNILGLLLIYMTTCMNPIIYVVMSSEYRQAYVSLLTCKTDVDPVNRSVTKIS